MIRIIHALHNGREESNVIAGVEAAFISYSKILAKNGCKLLNIIGHNACYKNLIDDSSTELIKISPRGRGDIISIMRLIFAVLKFRPDAIICHSGRIFFFLRIPAFLFKIPIITVNHQTNISKFRNSDVIFNVNSSFNGDREKYKIKGKMVTVPNFIDYDDNEYEPNELVNLRHPVRIGFLGRLAMEKNCDKLIKAIAILRDKYGLGSELILGGDGPDLNNLKLLANGLGINNSVKFLGWVNNKKEFFKNVDIFCLPSRIETFGIAILDAMYYHSPVITCDSVGPRDIIDNGVDGFLIDTSIEEKTPENIAEKIYELSQNLEKINQFRKLGYKKVKEKFMAKIVIEQIMSEVRAAIGRH